MSEKLPESPEAIAYLLMKNILKNEGKQFCCDNNELPPPVDKRASRQDILETYLECIDRVKRPLGYIK